MKNVSSKLQRGAAVLVGIICLAVLLLVGSIVAFLVLTQKEQPKITYQAPPVSADDKLTAGKSDNELVLDGRIIKAGLDRDNDQRSAATNVLADQALAIGDTTSDPATSVEQSRLSSLQTTFISESDRRLKALSAAQQLLPKLSDDQRPSSNKQISDETTAITGLKAKAASETTLAGFADDKTSLDKEYGNYLLATAQVYLLVWANAQSTLEGKMNIFGGKFQERLNAINSQGVDTSTAQTYLNTLQAKKTTATDLTDGSLKLIAVVKPGDYTANRSVLITYQKRLSTAHDQLSTGLDAAGSLVTFLKNQAP
jgi:hypothetical protein